MKKFLFVMIPLVIVAAAAIGGCGRSGGGQSQLLSLAQARGLSPEDAARAVKTFVPPGGRDEFLLFASGGHSGQIHVIGVPSMRLLKTIAVFTPEPWQGYGYGADWSEVQRHRVRSRALVVEEPGNPRGLRAGRRSRISTEFPRQRLLKRLSLGHLHATNAPQDMYPAG